MRPSRLLRGLALALPLVLFAALGLGLLRGLFPAGAVSYAEFERLLEVGRVERVVVRDNVAAVTLNQTTPVALPNSAAMREVTAFNVRLPSNQAGVGGGLISQLEARGVDYRFDAPSQWLGILLNFLPLLVPVILALFLLAALLVLLLRRRPADGFPGSKG